MNDGLRIRNLTKQYPDGTLANDRIDLEIRPGEVFGLLGPNGAGKTTLVKQIIGLLRPTSGSIELGGNDLVADPRAAREMCAFLPQGALPISSLKLDEAVSLVGRIRGGNQEMVQLRRDELIDALEVHEWRSCIGAQLSGGVLRLAGFIMAAVWPTPLIILDEPTNDVDPLRRRLLWREIRKAGQNGSAVLLVTHNVLEAEQSVDRLAVIDNGRIIAHGTPSSLKADTGDQLRLLLNLKPGSEEPVPPAFAQLLSRQGHRLSLLIQESDAVEAITWARQRSGHGEIEEYSLTSTTLEDAYLNLTDGTTKEANR